MNDTSSHDEPVTVWDIPLGVVSFGCVGQCVCSAVVRSCVIICVSGFSMSWRFCFRFFEDELNRRWMPEKIPCDVFFLWSSVLLFASLC